MATAELDVSTNEFQWKYSAPTSYSDWFFREWNYDHDKRNELQSEFLKMTKYMFILNIFLADLRNFEKNHWNWWKFKLSSRAPLNNYAGVQSNQNWVRHCIRWH